MWRRAFEPPTCARGYMYRGYVSWLYVSWLYCKLHGTTAYGIPVRKPHGVVHFLDSFNFKRPFN